MDCGVRHTPRHQTGLPAQDRAVIPVAVGARCRYPFAGASARLGVQTAAASDGKSVYTMNSLVTIIKLFYGLCECQGYYGNIAAGIRSTNAIRNTANCR